MSTDPATTIVLRDGDGAYYLLAPAVLEAARVPVARTAELEQAIGEQLGDTTGFAETVALYNRPGGAGLLAVPLNLTSSALVSYGAGPQLSPQQR